MKNGLITLDLIHFIREYRNRLCCGRAPAAGVLASFALDRHYLLCGSHGYRGAPPLGHLLCHGIKTYLLKEVPGEYLLPSQSGGPMTEAGILWVVKRVAKSEGITNDIHIQTLRHSYATHLLERG
jgi:integrase